MTNFSIANGADTDFDDISPGGGFIIDFYSLDNSFSLTINDVQLFVGGPSGAPNELQFQSPGTAGQTVRFADGDRYEVNTPAVWQLGNSDPDAPVVRLVVNPDGSVQLFGVKFNNGPLVPLELFNGMSVNTTAIANAWNDDGTNEVTLDQSITGPTNARGKFEDILCFASGTEIETDEGPVAVENLQIADNVLTYDNGFRPIRWIGSHVIGKEDLEAYPRLRPILIRANALGSGYPKQDLIISPQHRVLVSSAVAKRMFDSEDVLIPANKLLPLDGIETLSDCSEGIEYFHILFDAHEIIWSNGALTESLFTGPEALRSVSKQARREIKDLFPDLCHPEFEAVSARYIPKKGKLMRKLAERHQVNQKPLYS